MFTVLRRPKGVVTLAAIAGVVAVAGCGGGSVYDKPAAKAPASSSGAASVKLAKTGLGRILVDGSGRTLYLFEADKGPSSACSGACAAAWPPLTTSGKPAAGAGIASAKLGTARRSDGSTAVTYNGHPLYRYAGDGAPGQTTGEGLDDYGAEWYVLSPAGTKIEGSS